MSFTVVRPAFLPIALVIGLAAGPSSGCGGAGADDGDRPRGDAGLDAGDTEPDAGVVDCGALLECDGTCTVPLDDPANCGDCGGVCDGDQVCNAGFCALGCGLGTERCDDRCVATDADPASCGGCGRACADGDVCDRGRCVATCGGELTDCGGGCVDLASDRRHCGACDAYCEAGSRCDAGDCVPFVSTGDADDDGIDDADEGARDGIDTDGDGTPDYLDTDADADGITDADEAGDALLGTPPMDSDGDRTPDFRDQDADNDGLADRFEALLRSSPRIADTDGDGDTDPMEILAQSDVLDPGDDLSTRGRAGMVLPFDGDEVATAVRAVVAEPVVDVLLLVENTNALMGDGIQIVNETFTAADFGGRVAAEIRPDTGTALATFQDFPVNPYGGRFSSPLSIARAVQVSPGPLLDRAVSAASSGDEPSSALASLTFGLRAAGFRQGSRRAVFIAAARPFHRHWDDPEPGADRTTWCGTTRETPCSRYAEDAFVDAAEEPVTFAAVLGRLAEPGLFVLGLAFDALAAGEPSDVRANLASLAVRSGASRPCDGGELWDPDGPEGAAPAAPRCPVVFDGLLPTETRDLAASTAAFFEALGDGVDVVAAAPYRALASELVDDPTTPLEESALTGSFEAVSATDGPSCPDLDVAAVDEDDDGTEDVFVDACPGDAVTLRAVLRNDALSPRCEDQVFEAPIALRETDGTRGGLARVIVRIPGDRAACPGR